MIQEQPAAQFKTPSCTCLESHRNRRLKSEISDKVLLCRLDAKEGIPIVPILSGENPLAITQASHWWRRGTQVECPATPIHAESSYL